MKPALPAALQTFWQARDARERRALKLLAAFIAAALLIQALWSLESSRQRNLRQLPQLAAKAEWMRQAVDDWQRQNAQASQTSEHPAPRERLFVDAHSGRNRRGLFTRKGYLCG